jgi:putative transposase
MLLKIVFLLMRWLFSLAVLVVRGDRAKNAELLVLRHENAVPRRAMGPADHLPRRRARHAGRRGVTDRPQQRRQRSSRRISSSAGR